MKVTSTQRVVVGSRSAFFSLNNDNTRHQIRMTFRRFSRTIKFEPYLTWLLKAGRAPTGKTRVNVLDVFSCCQLQASRFAIVFFFHFFL